MTIQKYSDILYFNSGTKFYVNHLPKFNILIRVSGKTKKFDFHPGNLSMAVYTYEKPPKKVSGFVGHPVTRAINF